VLDVDAFEPGGLLEGELDIAWPSATASGRVAASECPEDVF